MDILIGNFGNVFATGTVINLTFSLFRQVREFGMRKIEKAIRKEFEEWLIEVRALLKQDPGEGKYCQHISKEVRELFDNALEKLKNKPMKKRILFCSLASMLCVIGLSLCAIFGEQTLALSKWTGKSFLCITLGISFLPMPIALAWTIVENIKIRNDFTKKIEMVREITQKKLDKAVSDMYNKIIKK